MSDKIEKCEAFKIVHQYGPPCFIGPSNEPQCTYETTETECGISLGGLPYNDQTQALSDVARRTGTPTILSLEDASAKFLEAEGRLLVGSKVDSKKIALILYGLHENDRRAVLKKAQTFLDDTRTLLMRKPMPKEKGATLYIVPSPFHTEQELGVFYQRLIDNRKAPEGATPSIEVQVHDAAMSLRASPLYQKGTPEMQRTIKHVTEDLINGIDPEHCKILESAIVFGATTVALGFIPIALGAGLAEGLMTPTAILSGLGLVAATALAVRYGSYAYMDYNTHADSIRLQMYNYASPIECDDAVFGKNIGTDQKCFGYTAFDLGAGLREGFPDAPKSERLRLIREYPNHVIR